MREAFTYEWMKIRILKCKQELNEEDFTGENWKMLKLIIEIIFYYLTKNFKKNLLKQNKDFYKILISWGAFSLKKIYGKMVVSHKN